jgi:phosphoheptose isomerase
MPRPRPPFDSPLPSGSDVATAVDRVRKLRDRLERLDHPSYLDHLCLIAEAVAERTGRGGRVLLCGSGPAAGLAASLASSLGRDDVSAFVVGGAGADLRAEVRARGRAGDALIALSGTALPDAVTEALAEARAASLYTVVLCGLGACSAEVADQVVPLPADDEADVYELELVSGHIVVDLVRRHRSSLRPPTVSP